MQIAGLECGTSRWCFTQFERTKQSRWQNKLQYNRL